MGLSSSDLDAVVAGQTVASLFVDQVKARSDSVALRWRPAGSETATASPDLGGVRRPGLPGGGRAGRLSGSGPGERVVLMMRNRPEFHCADVGVLLAGATPISIYNSSSPEQIEYLVNHSEAVAAIVGDVGMLERFLKVRSEFSTLEKLVLDRRSRRPGPGGRRALRRAARRRSGRPRGGRRPGPSRRPCHAHLHLGHDRPAQGRDDLPLQPLLGQREHGPGHRRAARRLAAGVLPPHGPHRRAAR